MSKAEEHKEVVKLRIGVESPEAGRDYPDEVDLILWDNGVREMSFNYSRVLFTPETWLVFVDLVAALTRAELPRVHEYRFGAGEGGESRYEPLHQGDPRVQEALANLKRKL